MSIQVYECADHGRDEVFLRSSDIPPTRECPCGKIAVHVISAPARIHIDRDWNEKANDAQGHGVYNQAKAQITNMYNETRDREERHDTPAPKVTEEAIQAAAVGLDKEQRTRATRPTPQQKQVAFARKQEKKLRTPA